MLPGQHEGAPGQLERSGFVQSPPPPSVTPHVLVYISSLVIKGPLLVELLASEADVVEISAAGLA